MPSLGLLSLVRPRLTRPLAPALPQGYTICVPFLTTHLRSHYHVSDSFAGLVFVSYTLGSVASTPLVEHFIDRLDCNGAICAALVALGLSQAAFTVASTVWVLILARFLGGVGAGLTWSTVLTACHHMASEENDMGKLFGIVLSAVSIGTMVGPALGGVLYSMGGWSVPFVSVTVVCSVAAVAVAALLPEIATHAASESRPSLKHGCFSPAAVELAMVLLLVMSGGVLFSSVDTVLPMHLEDRFQGSSVLSGSLFLTIAVRPAICPGLHPAPGTITRCCGPAPSGVLRDRSAHLWDYR